MLASCFPCLSRGPAKSYTAWCLGLVVHRCVKLCRNGVPLRFWCFRSINYCKSYVAKFKVYSEIVTFPRGCMDSDCTWLYWIPALSRMGLSKVVRKSCAMTGMVVFMMFCNCHVSWHHFRRVLLHCGPRIPMLLKLRYNHPLCAMSQLRVPFRSFHSNMFAATPRFARGESRISFDMLESLRRVLVVLLSKTTNPKTRNHKSAYILKTQSQNHCV